MKSVIQNANEKSEPAITFPFLWGTSYSGRIYLRLRSRSVTVAVNVDLCVHELRGTGYVWQMIDTTISDDDAWKQRLSQTKGVILSNDA